MYIYATLFVLFVVHVYVCNIGVCIFVFYLCIYRASEAVMTKKETYHRLKLHTTRTLNKNQSAAYRDN